MSARLEIAERIHDRASHRDAGCRDTRPDADGLATGEGAGEPTTGSR